MKVEPDFGSGKECRGGDLEVLVNRGTRSFTVRLGC